MRYTLCITIAYCACVAGKDKEDRKDQGWAFIWKSWHYRLSWTIIWACKGIQRKKKKVKRKMDKEQEKRKNRKKKENENEKYTEIGTGTAFRTGTVTGT